MKLKIEIDCNGAAFGDGWLLASESARILRGLAGSLVDGLSPREPIVLRDINGNRVGQCLLTEDDMKIGLLARDGSEIRIGDTVRLADQTFAKVVGREGLLVFHTGGAADIDNVRSVEK